MDDLQSWRGKLEVLKRLPRPSKSQNTPRTSRSLDTYVRTPHTAPVDLRSALRKRQSDLFLKPSDKNALEFSYKPVKDVDRFKDSPTPDLPHRPDPNNDPHTAVSIIKSKCSESRNELNKLSASHSHWHLYTSRSMNDIPHRTALYSGRGHLITREMIKLKIFHRHTDYDELRYIPECLDTTSEFYNPRVSADDRFDKYLEEMRRINTIGNETLRTENAKREAVEETTRPANNSDGYTVLPQIHGKYDTNLNNIGVSKCNVNSSRELPSRIKTPTSCR